MIYAIADGLRTPPSPSSPSSNAGIIAGVIGSVLFVGLAGAAVTYYKVPAFRSTVDSAAGGLRGSFSGLLGRKSYKPVVPGGMGSSSYNGQASSSFMAGSYNSA